MHTCCAVHVCAPFYVCVFVCVCVYVCMHVYASVLFKNGKGSFPQCIRVCEPSIMAYSV